MKVLRVFLIMFLFCALTTTLFVSFGSGQAGGRDVYCKDVFPGTCTQGGCGAELGWEGQDCVIKCTKDKNGFWNTITCQRPQEI